MSDFDPYYKWLAIPPSEQPPNHYRLLGVPVFTADADVIENAADQRMSHLRSFQVGKHSADSQRLLNEVSHARACLLVPERRKEYDAALKKKLEPAPQPVQQPIQQPLPQQLPQVVVRPVIPQFVVPAAPVAPAQPQFVPPRPQFAPPPQQYAPMPPQPQPLPLPARTPIPVQQSAPQPVAPRAVAPTPPTIAVSNTRKRKPAAGADVPKHIAASVVGILLGYLIVCLILPRYDVLGLFHRRPADPPTVAQHPPPLTPEPITPKPAVSPQPLPPASVNSALTPREAKRIEPPPAATKINDTPKTEPPSTTIKAPDPTPAVLLPNDAAQQQARVTKLKADRATALEKNEISAVLLMTDELAKLEAADPLVERARMIEELRKGERSPAEVVLLTTQLIDVVAAASKAERHDFAAEQATTALLLARKSGDQELVKKATKLVLEVQEKKSSP